MHTKTGMGVRISEQGAMPDWTGARLFLEVVRHGSFRAAAQTLHMSVSALRHRFGEFEQQIGQTLATRHVDGIRLTAEGELILAAAKRMEVASFDFLRARGSNEALHGEVKLSVTEGLGTFWLAPRLVEFQRAHPQILVDMRCAMHPADVLRAETDLAVQITPPQVDNLKVVKLGRIHAIPFASQEYLDKFGTPATREELLRHRICLQIADRITTVENFQRLFPGAPEVGSISVKSNVSSAHYWFIARGAGIGMLPTYAPAVGARVVPLDIAGVYIAHDILLTFHPDASRVSRVRRLIDFLKEAFSPHRYPWFRDEFIHPRDLPRRINDMPISDLFEGFVGMEQPGKCKPAKR
jgi:DNA-binding transcriptional LysR family regulator